MMNFISKLLLCFFCTSLVVAVVHGSSRQYSQTTPEWEDRIERVSLQDFKTIAESSLQDSQLASRRHFQKLFPIQHFENVCLRFQSEGTTHWLRGGSKYWQSEPCRTTLVILRREDDSSIARNRRSTWPPPKPLPLVLSTNESHKWTSLNWDVVPPNARMNEAAPPRDGQPKRLYSRQPGVHASQQSQRAPRCATKIFMEGKS